MNYVPDWALALGNRGRPWRPRIDWLARLDYCGEPCPVNRLPPPPAVPAEAREVALTVPPPSRYEEALEVARLCIACVSADATHGRPEAYQAGRTWLRCYACHLAFQRGPELEGPDDAETWASDQEIRRDRLAYG